MKFSKNTGSFVTLFLMLIVLCSEKHANASENTESIQSCNEEIRYDAVAGTKCETKKHAIYVRVTTPKFGMGWQAPNGLIFSVQNSTDIHKASADCEKLGGWLPSYEDYKNTDDIYGLFGEVLSDNDILWVSSQAETGFFTTTHESILVVNSSIKTIMEWDPSEIRSVYCVVSHQ